MRSLDRVAKRFCQTQQGLGEIVKNLYIGHDDQTGVPC